MNTPLSSVADAAAALGVAASQVRTLKSKHAALLSEHIIKQGGSPHFTPEGVELLRSLLAQAPNSNLEEENEPNEILEPEDHPSAANPPDLDADEDWLTPLLDAQLQTLADAAALHLLEAEAKRRLPGMVRESLQRMLLTPRDQDRQRVERVIQHAIAHSPVLSPALMGAVCSSIPALEASIALFGGTPDEN